LIHFSLYISLYSVHCQCLWPYFFNLDSNWVKRVGPLEFAVHFSIPSKFLSVDFFALNHFSNVHAYDSCNIRNPFCLNVELRRQAILVLLDS
jgi:hypothetical protein